MTLTPFWHRRICEAIAVFCLLIIGLYFWSNSVGISNPTSQFFVSPLAAGISVGAIILAAISYFLVPEAFRTSTAYAAYWVLLFAVGALNMMTGASNSPFIATWMIAVIFAGIFGPLTLGLLFVVLNAYFGYILMNHSLSNASILSFVLAGELPILVSYILWHGKSSTEKTKERAYYDLANELDQVSNKAEVVINAISDGVIAVGNQGQIELINPAAQRMVGWGNQDALNLNYKSVLQLLTQAGTEVEKSNDPVLEVLTTNQATRADMQLQTNSGKKINIEIVVSPIGRIGSGAIIVFRDVTKEQEEERAQAEFISTASHEMRTPVASIEGYLGLALNAATATVDSRARDFIGKAHASAQHLGRLFQDLLDVTKAEDGRLSNNPKAINVVEFINEIIEGLEPKAKEKNLRLFFRPVDSNAHGQRNLEPVFYVNVDEDHLREVISNLVENAIKYTLAGEVVIDVKGDDSHVIISVSDSGIGIPREDIPHLFQKFYRVDNSDTREIGGTGLGLYLCRRLIEAMGGRIWVDSEYKKGSTFSVELSRISHEEAMHLIEAASNETTSPGTVAYVQVNEDDDRPTPEQRAQALATPIIMKKDAAISHSTAPAPAPTETVDPLVAAAPTPAPAAPAAPQTATTVLPPALQALESNVQRAQQSQAVPPVPTPPAAMRSTPATPAAPATPATQPSPAPGIGTLPPQLQALQPVLTPKPATPPAAATAQSTGMPLTVPERQKA